MDVLSLVRIDVLFIVKYIPINKNKIIRDIW